MEAKAPLLSRKESYDSLPAYSNTDPDAQASPFLAYPQAQAPPFTTYPQAPPFTTYPQDPPSSSQFPPNLFFPTIPRFPLTSSFPLSFPPGALYLPLSPETRPKLKVWGTGDETPCPSEILPLLPKPTPPSRHDRSKCICAIIRLQMIAMLFVVVGLFAYTLTHREDPSDPFDLVTNNPAILSVTFVVVLFFLISFFAIRKYVRDPEAGHYVGSINDIDVIEQARSVAPVIQMNIECYHYVSGYDSQNKVVSQKQSHHFQYTSSTDFSSDASSLLEESSIIQLKMEPQLFFEDEYTRACFEAEERAFIENHRLSDEHLTYTLSLSFPNLKKRCIMLRDPERRPFLLGTNWMTVATTFGLEVLYLRWLRSVAPKVIYPIKKAIGRRPLQ